MKAKDIAIGSTYLVKVSGQVVPVRVTGSREVASGRDGFRTVWDAINVTTRRRVVVRSPQRLRGRFGREAEERATSERLPSEEVPPG